MKRKPIKFKTSYGEIVEVKPIIRIEKKKKVKKKSWLSGFK